MMLVGTSGWSFDEWVGPFYPISMRAAPEAWLGYYATRFRTVEITSTFDVTPDEDLVASWSRAGALLHAQGPFEFSLKLPRAITHDAIVNGELDLAWETAARFERHVLEPLADEGLLGAVLLQLPPTARPTALTVRALEETLRALQGRSVAIDAQHPSWWTPEGAEVAPQARPLFDDRDVTLVESDASAAARRTPPASHAYVRLPTHDPTARDQAIDAPDHLYGADELERIAARCRAHEEADRVVRVYFTNTPHAKGVVNGVELQHLLGNATSIPRPRLTQQSKLPV